MVLPSRTIHKDIQNTLKEDIYHYEKENKSLSNYRYSLFHVKC